MSMSLTPNTDTTARGSSTGHTQHLHRSIAFYQFSECCKEIVITLLCKITEYFTSTNDGAFQRAPASAGPWQNGICNGLGSWDGYQSFGTCIRGEYPRSYARRWQASQAAPVEPMS